MSYIYNRRSSRWASKLKNTLRDYMVPIIIGGVVLLLIFFIFFKWWEDSNQWNENQTGIDLVFDSSASEATIIFPGDSKKDITTDSILYKWEKIIVKQWTVTIKDWTSLEFKVNKLWELKYWENWKYEMTSWDIWLNANSPVSVIMNYATLNVQANSHLSMTQNEMWSTIYLISWLVEVSNNWGKTTVLAPSEKITISRTDASNKDIDLSLLKDSIDQFFIKSDWYILNRGSSFEWGSIDEENNENPISGTWTTSTKSSQDQYLTFNNLIDWSNVSAWTINISGTYNSDEVNKITINWKEASITSSDKSFKVEWVSVPNRENDLVIKVFDWANDTLSKFVYTVYYNSWVSNNSSNSWGNRFPVQTYDVDGTQFTFTSPTTSNTYTTSEWFITIRWKVLASGVTSVTVNDYKLASYESAWWTWRYHASTDNNNLAMWTNVYEIKYYSGTNVVYTNYFTIIRKENIETTPESQITQPDSAITPEWEFFPM